MECEGGGRNTIHRPVKRSLCAVILIIWFTIVMCQTSSANNITYTYVGNPFTLFTGIDQCPSISAHLSSMGWKRFGCAPPDKRIAFARDELIYRPST